MTTVSIDPRLRARRSAVLRAEGRKRLKRLLVALIVIAVVVVGWLVARSSLMNVDSVSWSGLDQVTLAEATEAAGIEVGTSLIDVDPGSVETRLEALPWLDEVTVHRSWTGAVRIDVVEREAAALVMRQQNVWVAVDETGMVLTEAIVRNDLPRISGVGAAGAPGSQLSGDAAAALEVVALLPEQVRVRTEGVARDARGEMWLSLTTADRILLGSDDDLALKVVSLTTVLEELDTEGRIGWEMDVSVPTLPVVRDLRAEWQPIPADDSETEPVVEVEG